MNQAKFTFALWQSCAHKTWPPWELLVAAVELHFPGVLGSLVWLVQTQGYPKGQQACKGPTRLLLLRPLMSYAQNGLLGSW